MKFPITSLLPRIRASLAAHPRLVLAAPPGAGKTTQVPPALLREPWLAGKKIVLLEPRRIAARAAAEFMAAQRGEAVGQTVGYRIRFEARVSDATRIEVVTEGILTRMLQDDPELPAIGAIVFDEFHERHLAGDLGAALALDVQASLRPDLRLIVMSATLGDPRIAGRDPGPNDRESAIHGKKTPWFDAPILRSEGRAFPVHIEYPPSRRDETLESRVRRAVQHALDDTDGDVLVFLPGRREITQAQRVLEETVPPFPRLRGKVPGGRIGANLAQNSPHPNPPPQAGEGVVPCVEILPLHGELPLAEQHAALAPRGSSVMDGAGTRRVILATNVAESSITVPDVRAVIDTGLAREPRFDPNSGLTRLITVNISQASADQRAGRAGRVAPGITYRLWPESQRLEPSRIPEIAQVELSGLALELAAWGVGMDVTTLRWLDPPPGGALAQARELLQRLGAVDGDFHITALGRNMQQLGTNPRMAAAALRAPESLHALLADLLALLESRSPLRGGFNDDLRVRLNALHAWRDGGMRSVRNMDAGALSAIEHTSRGWRRRLGARHAASGTPDELAIGNLLLHAFPDRVAKQDAKDPRRYLLANGRGARLHEDSTLFGEPWLIVIEARFDTRDSLVLSAVPFDATLLERDYRERFTRERMVRQNSNDVVEAFEVKRFDAIVLSQRAVPVSPDDALPALLSTVRSRGIGMLPWSDAATRLRARVAWLRRVMPEADLPEVSDSALLDSLETWLAPALVGKRKLGAMSSNGFSDAFAALLEYRQRKMLDDFAPEVIAVPSGMKRKLDYAVDLHADTGVPSPVLAVKLQELFGLAETPRVANGRVPVTLHLLSPAGRPIQVTQDLRGFWERTYVEVRKELKGRYPKHPWPEDPWSATPTHRAKRRS